MDVLAVGREARPVVVIDDFAPFPERWRAAAAAAAYGPARHHYPGIRARLPDGYWEAVDRPVRAAVAAIMGRAMDHELIDSSFSIVTAARDTLSVGQRLPHCDARAADRVALVHYLADGDAAGGTAFFRHRSTGFEAVDARRATVYDGQLEAELRHGGPPPPDYPGPDDRLFERTALVAARWNRAVLYPSMLLHSGAIPAGASLSPDPAVGRVTVTGFLRAVA